MGGYKALEGLKMKTTKEEMTNTDTDKQKLRQEIGKILVKNNLRTNQVAISELVVLVESLLHQQKQELDMKHAMELAGVQAQVEQNAMIRASELLDEKLNQSKSTGKEQE